MPFTGDRRLGGFANKPGLFASKNFDLNTPEGLLELARLQGGAIGEAAEDLINPERSFLSQVGATIGGGFLKFVDTILIPSKVVAGILSADHTIKEAIDQKLMPSDVLFGEADPEATGMQKVSNFFIRLATDILLDPITYVTFGAAKGIFGITAALKVPVGEKGFKTFKALSKRGEELFQKRVQMQIKGLEANALKTGAVRGLEGADLKRFVKSTLDADFTKAEVVEFAKESIGNLIRYRPDLGKTLLDKGGIKFFGTSIISGYRISAIRKVIPGITWADHVTSKLRNALGSLFNRDIDASFGRLPDEMVQMEQKYRDLLVAKQVARNSTFSDLVKATKLTRNEAEFLMNTLEVGTIPADPRLANAFLKAKGINKRDLNLMRANGVKVHELGLHMPHVLVDEKVANIPFRMPPKTSTKFAEAARQIEGTVKEINDKIGKVHFDPNVVSALAKRGTRIDIATTMKDLVREFGAKYGLPMSKAPANWRTLQIKGLEEEVIDFSKFIVTTEGESLYFHPLVAKRIEEFSGSLINDEATTKVLGLFDKVQGLFKASVTSIFAAFHGRNALSNVFLHYEDIGLHSLNPANHALATDLLFKEMQASRLTQKMAGIGKEALAVTSGMERIGTAGHLGYVPKTKLGMKLGDEFGAKNLAAEFAQVESDAFDHIARVTEKNLLEQAETQFGKVVNTDDIRTLFPGYAGFNSVGVHEPSSYLGKKLYQKKLRDNVGKGNNTVFFTAGGTGVGKTTSIRGLEKTNQFFIDSPIIYDNHLAGFGTSIEKISAALRSGYKVHIGYVFRNPLESFTKGVLPRAIETGRVVPIEAHITSHINARSTILKLAERFKNNSNFSLDIIDNTGGLGRVKFGSLDQVSKDVYDVNRIEQLRKALHVELETQKAANTISERTYRATKAEFGFQDDFVHSVSGYGGQPQSALVSPKGLTEGVVKTTAAKEKFTELMETVVYKDTAGYDWTFGELRSLIKDKQVAFSPQLTGALDVRVGGKEFIDALFPENFGGKLAKDALPITQEFLPFRVGRRFGRMVEEQARLVDFLVNLQKTGDPTLAAIRTKEFLFDYQNLSNFERVFMRRLIPFYTFTRKNIGRQVSSLFVTPGRIVSQVKVLNTLGDVMSGGKLTEEEKKNLPDWVKNGAVILIAKKGSTIEILQSLGTPLEQPFGAFSMSGFLGSISPIIRVPLEQATGYSMFQQKPLQEITNAAAFKSAPKVIKDFIGFTEVKGKKPDGTEFNWFVSLRPSRLHILLNLPPTSRVLSSLKQMQTQDVSTQFRVMQQLIGVRPFTFDLEQQANLKERELRRRLQDMLTSARVTAQFERTFIPKENSPF